MSSPPFLLLINPWITDFAAYDLWSKPLGLMIIAALLEQGGAGIAYIDCLDRHDLENNQRNDILPPTHKKYGTGKYPKIPIATPGALETLPRRYYRYGLHPKIFSDRLEQIPRPDLVLVTSSMTYWYPGVQHTIAWVRRHHPDVPIWLGGIYARLCTQHAGLHSGADYVFDKNLATLRTLLESTLDYKFRNPTSWDHPSRWPIPKTHAYIHSGHYAPLLTSLGCPYHCPYCASSRLEPEFVRLPTQSIIDQVQHGVQNHQIKDFAFYDDALLYRAEETLKPALEALAAADLGIRLHAPNAVHVNLLTPTLCKLLQRCGLKNLQLGLETTEAHLERLCGGKTNFDIFLKVINNLEKAGFSKNRLGVYLMCGLPGQTPQDVFNSIQLVKQSGARPMLSEYSPIPGTKLFSTLPASDQQILIDEPLYHNNSYFFCRRPDFTYDDLVALKQEARLARRAQSMV